MVSLSVRPGALDPSLYDDGEDDEDFSVDVDSLPTESSSPEQKLDFVKSALQRAYSYREKADQAAQALRGYRAPPGQTLLTIGSALLQPTRTGTFGETLGNVGQAVGALQEQRAVQDYKQRLLEAQALEKRYGDAAKGQETLAGIGARAAFAKPSSNITFDALGRARDKTTGAIIDVPGATGASIFKPETRDGVRGQIDTRTGEWKPFEKYAQPGGDKGAGMLPAALQKAEDADLEAIGTLSSTAADINSLMGQIDSGELNLSLMGNLGNQAKNALGMGDEKSAAYDAFKSTLTTIANNALLLAKGVQTEGDAQRAKAALMSGMSSEKVVREQLKRIAKINERSARLKAQVLQRRRTGRGLEALDLSEFTDMPSALGTSPKPSERPPLSSFMPKK